MGNYKLVPVGRPQIRDAYLRNGFTIAPDRDDLEDRVYEAAFELLELVAPAVQGELAGVAITMPGTTGITAAVFDAVNVPPGTQVYTAPQPAEQQPIRHDWDDQDKCRRCGDRDWYASATCSPKQQPAPEVAGLEQQHHRDSAELRRLCQARDEQRNGRLAALERAAKAEADIAMMVDALDLARNDLSDWIASFPEESHTFTARIIARIDAALAAHRKQGGEA